MAHSNLSTRDLAKLLNMNVSTVKRWADSGQLPCVRTPGGHRRFNVEDIHDFLEAKGISPRSLAPIVERMIHEEKMRTDVDEAILSRDWEWLQNHLISLARLSDVSGVVRLLVAAYVAGVHPAALSDHLISPAMGFVGTQWETNRLSVADEHLITHTITSALGEMPTQWGRERELPLRALVACLAPDQHELACHCVTHVLAFEGWHVSLVGASTPAESLVAAIEKIKPDLVCLSATIIYEPVAYRTDCERILHALESYGGRLAVGGSAVRVHNISCSNEAATTIRDMNHLVQFVRDTFPRACSHGAMENGDGEVTT